MSSSLAHPPDTMLFPLLALDSFLESMEPLHSPGNSNAATDGTTSETTAPSTADTDAMAHKKDIARKKRILQVADCLFGSMLEGALTILDSYEMEEIESVQSRRKLFVLTNNSATRKYSAHGASRNHDEPSSYFCLLPRSSKADNHKNHSQQQQYPLTGFYYCSCRSYFERTKSIAGKHCDQPHLRPEALCKHLLALKLRPHLLDECKKTETVSEVQFAHQCLLKLFGG